MPDNPRREVMIRQQFDFAAAHRLHVDSLDEAQNRAVFGRCNNPAGHGHNYRIEPCISMPVDPTRGPAITLAAIEDLVDRVLIDAFDHTHLNHDTAEFGPGGRNPSVENIAMVFYARLHPAVAAAAPGARLRSITVWETDRTCCTYPADPADSHAADQPSAL